MDKHRLLAKLERSWQAFKASYAGLAADQMLASGVTGDWSVKDLIAHVTWWEHETLRHLPHILQGHSPPRYSDLYGGIDAFNAQMTEIKRGLPLSVILAQAEETHRQLVAYLHSLPDEHFASETRFRRRLRLDTYSHYPLHTQAILAWRSRSS